MSIIRIFYLAFFLVLLCGCSLMLSQRILFGVKKPKVKEISEIQKFIIRKSQIDSTLSLNKSSFTHKIFISSTYFSKWELFDRNGNLIIPLDTNVKHCNGYTHNFFQNLQDKNFEIDKQINFHQDTLLLNGLTYLNGREYLFQKKNDTDYLLVIYWSTFMGKYSTDLLNLEKIAKNNSSVSIETLVINMDFKKYYGISNSEINIKQSVKAD